jgi:hypothetical protein
VTRRLAFLPLSLIAAIAVLLGACSTAPAAPALTDPKDIITKGVTSLADVKSVEFTGTFSGTVTTPQLGTFDLSKVTMSGALDVSNKAAKFNLNASEILGTQIDARLLGTTAYYKIAGMLAMVTGGQADKFTKVEVPAGSGDPGAVATDPTKAVAELQQALAKLPATPTKEADDKCGDADCYHVKLAMTAADLQALGSTMNVGDGSLTVDLFTLKQNYRPARLVLSVTAPEVGTIGMTVELRYDVGVSVQAPAADQIVQP